MKSKTDKALDATANSIGFFMWLRIFASPFLIGLFLAFILWNTLPTPYRSFAAAGVGLAGLATGIWFAESMRRKHGTVWFMSRVNASPELNKQDNSVR